MQIMSTIKKLYKYKALCDTFASRAFKTKLANLRHNEDSSFTSLMARGGKKYPAYACNCSQSKEISQKTLLRGLINNICSELHRSNQSFWVMYITLCCFSFSFMCTTLTLQNPNMLHLEAAYQNDNILCYVCEVMMINTYGQENEGTKKLTQGFLLVYNFPGIGDNASRKHSKRLSTPEDQSLFHFQQTRIISN